MLRESISINGGETLKLSVPGTPFSKRRRIACTKGRYVSAIASNSQFSSKKRLNSGCRTKGKCACIRNRIFPGAPIESYYSVRFTTIGTIVVGKSPSLSVANTGIIFVESGRSSSKLKVPSGFSGNGSPRTWRCASGRVPP